MRYSNLFSNSLRLFKDSTKALDLQLLMGAAFNFTRAQFWMRKDETITDGNALRTFYRYRQRLLKEEPIAYILKKKEFYGEIFYVNKNVLIPRPETEILVEQAIRLTKEPVDVLDIGAGSGVIFIMLAKHIKCKVTAVESSPKALYILKKNIAVHHVGDRVTPLRTDLFPLPGEKFAVIVSNPPYVSEEEWRELESVVRDYEPRAALVAGEGGLAIIKRIVLGSVNYLEPGGKLLMEIGYNQSQRVRDILKKTGFSSVQFFKDYSGIPRVVYGELKK